MALQRLVNFAEMHLSAVDPTNVEAMPSTGLVGFWSLAEPAILAAVRELVSDLACDGW